MPRTSPSLATATALAVVGGLAMVGFTVREVLRDELSVPPGIATATASTSPEPSRSPEPSPAPYPTGSPSPLDQPSATPMRPPTQTSTEAASSPAAIQLESLLARVAVVPARPNVDGYDRSCSPGAGCSFGTDWNDDTTAELGHNGCDTRNDVLRQQLHDIMIDPDTQGCVVRSGVLDDPYTGGKVGFRRGPTTSNAVEIDHLIPLAAAWDLGAWRWPQRRRNAFANDPVAELLAVDGPANQQKSDSTPASWLPPNKAFRCEYAILYLTAALTWELPVTAADVEVIRHVQRRCG